MTSCSKNSPILVFFYLFPTGRFVPRWTRWLSVGAILYWGFKYFLPPSPFNPYKNIVFSSLGFLLFVGFMIVAQVYRYLRISNSVQRQQTKWVVFGVSIAIGGYIVLVLVFAIFFPSASQSPLADILFYTTSYLLLLLIPISIAFAILRYRLWDIDLIINRTLVYGLLTAIVVGLYVLVVGGLSTLLQARGNLIISLLATGLIARHADGTTHPLPIRFTIPPGSAILEIGSTLPSRTWAHLIDRGGSLARWPYGHKRIRLMVNLDETSMVSHLMAKYMGAFRAAGRIA